MEFPQKTSLKCNICGKLFNVKSNLTRHSKTHSGTPEFQCSICNKSFNLRQHLDRHKKIHLYPTLPLYTPNEVRLQCSDEAKHIEKQPTKEALDNVWQNPVTAEAAAKSQGGELWRTCVKLTWGKYRGMSFKWLLENDVGWVVWIVSTFIVEGDKNPLMSWQKQTLLDFVRQFSLVMVHVDKRLKRKQVRAT